MEAYENLSGPGQTKCQKNVGNAEVGGLIIGGLFGSTEAFLCRVTVALI